MMHNDHIQIIVQYPKFISDPESVELHLLFA